MLDFTKIDAYIKVIDNQVEKLVSEKSNYNTSEDYDRDSSNVEKNIATL